MASDDTAFPAIQAAAVCTSSDTVRWLIEPLWFSEGVGVLGGHPKAFKTHFAADLALSVASGSKALSCFDCGTSGPVLFYGAEDSLAALRTRFLGLCQARSIALDEVPLYLLDVPTMALNLSEHLNKLRATVKHIQPKLLVLDPFIRIAGQIDENSSADVSTILGHLRALQRDYRTAVLLLHHARKSPAAHFSQALRGSSDFAAWSDTNLFLARKNNALVLHLDHRHAKAPDPITIQICQAPALHLVAKAPPLTSADSDHPPLHPPLHQDTLEALAKLPAPPSTETLRTLLRCRKQTLIEALSDLAQQGHIRRTETGWLLL